VEDLPIDNPPPPPVVVPPTAPTAKDNANFKPSTVPAPVAGTTPLPGATPKAGATSLPGVTPTPLPGTVSTPVPGATLENEPPTISSGEAEADSGLAESAPIDFASVWNQPFMRQALLAGVLVALVCGYLGVYVVLKRIVFIGVALSEFSSAGIALALFAGFSPLLGALAFMVCGVALFALRISPRRVPQESFIGIIYVIAGALAILLISKSHGGETHMLQLLQGDVLLIDLKETWQMMATFGVLAVLHLLFIKPFILTSFDRDAAATLGFNAQGWDFLLFLTIGLAIAFSIRASGMLMTTTMLIIPAVTALLLVNRLKWVFVVAPLVAVVPVAIGLHISFVADLPASAVIVALSFLLLLPALAYSACLKH
jgi:ABC-type Mn2+/Zn2+ transport system permease subunit